MVRLYDRLLDLLAGIAALLILALMIGIAIDVGARYFVGRPIGWMTEVIEHSLVVILFLGMPWLAREQGHVAIDLVVEHAPTAVRRVLKPLAAALAGLTSLFLTYWALLATLDNWRRGVETFGIYPIPKFWLIAVATIGLGLSGVEFLRRMVLAAREAAAPLPASIDTGVPPRELT